MQPIAGGPALAAVGAEAGQDKVLHLAINSDTDLALFNALLTDIAAQGWGDRAFIKASTLRDGGDRPPLYPARGISEANPGHLTSFEDAVQGCRLSIKEAAAITGLEPADIVKAAEWIAMPKADGSRRRTRRWKRSVRHHGRPQQARRCRGAACQSRQARHDPGPA